MKRKGNIIFFAVLALLLISVISSEISLQNVKGDPQEVASDKPAPGSIVDDWSMYRHDLQRTGTSISPVPMAACFGDSTLAIKSAPLQLSPTALYTRAQMTVMSTL